MFPPYIPNTLQNTDSLWHMVCLEFQLAFKQQLMNIVDIFGVGSTHELVTTHSEEAIDCDRDFRRGNPIPFAIHATVDVVDVLLITIELERILVCAARAQRAAKPRTALRLGVHTSHACAMLDLVGVVLVCCPASHGW